MEIINSDDARYTKEERRGLSMKSNIHASLVQFSMRRRSGSVQTKNTNSAFLHQWTGFNFFVPAKNTM